MEMMKKIAALAAVLLLPLYALAQEATYALPFTSFTVEVDVVQDIHFAGPYSAFAGELLNLDVPESDTRDTYIKEIRIIPHLEADPWAPRYTAPSGNSTMLALSAQGLISFGDVQEVKELQWRFTPQTTSDFGTAGITTTEKTANNIVYKTVKTETGEVRYPVEHTVIVAKTVEDKAVEAAEMIMSARKDRHNIAIGNTDANYAGESMAAALGELTKIEEENLLLFTGYDARKEYHASLRSFLRQPLVLTVTPHFTLRTMAPSSRTTKLRERPTNLNSHLFPSRM